MKKFIKRLSLTAVIFCVFALGRIHLGDLQSQQENQLILEVAAAESSDPLAVEEDGVKTEEVNVSTDEEVEGYDFSVFGNDDVVGVIEIGCLDLAYPVLQDKESNQTYLRKNFQGKEDRNGSIILEKENSSDFSDAYNLIYGHNMKSGAMFGSLKKIDQKMVDENPNITIHTPSATKEYEIFAICGTSVEDGGVYTVQYKNNTEIFGQFLNDITSHSVVSSDVQVDSSDNVIALSTCNGGDNRLVVFAVEL